MVDQNTKIIFIRMNFVIRGPTRSSITNQTGGKSPDSDL